MSSLFNVLYVYLFVIPFGYLCNTVKPVYHGCTDDYAKSILGLCLLPYTSIFISAGPAVLVSEKYSCILPLVNRHV